MDRDRQLKLLGKLEQNPKAVRPEFLESVLQAFGYARIREKGSHQTYAKPDGSTRPLIIPYKRPHIGRFYVEQVIAQLRVELGKDKRQEGKRRAGEEPTD